MSSAWVASRSAFRDAASWFVETTARVGDRWAAPGLGEWDVRSLVGHTSRSLLTVETYLAAGAERVDVYSAVGYLRATAAAAASPGVAARGRKAGLALGEEPVLAVREIAERVVGLMARRRGDELVGTLAGGMRLAAYLPTRTFELTVHTADLAVALGEPVGLPAAAAREALGLVVGVVADDERGAALLLAATGRRGLPEGFSILRP